jgi:enoyl-CoA hydratase
MSNSVIVQGHGPLRVVRFNRPEIRNPLSVKVLDEIEQILDDVEHKESPQTVVFTGSHGVFASGADLREIATVTAEAAPEFARRGQRLMNRIDALSHMTIAAVNGLCYGGALDLALACDKRFALPNATFCHPGTGLGIITGWGGTQRLPRLVGQGNSMEMLFTAEPIQAARALAMGLLDEITDDLDRRVLEFVSTSEFG